MKLKSKFLLAPMLASACITQADEAAEPGGEAVEETGEATQQINGDDVPASQYYLDRAVAIPGCTATRIARDWAITAMHCSPSVGSNAVFYTTGPARDTSVLARIAEVIYRPGASPDSCCDDVNGTFADVALLRLTNHPSRTDLPEGHAATLAWSYPGEDVWGTKVGAGNHDWNDNPDRVLLQVSDTLDSPTDSGGYFTTTHDNTQPGDSGGPFYVNNRILGTLKGSGWDPWDGEWNKYTSVPEHLSWILTKIGYRWMGTPSQAGTRYAGSAIESFTGDERECQYACEKTGSCDAYNYFVPLSQCTLLDNVTGYAAPSSSYRSALHYGQSAGNSNEVVNFVRSDGLTSFLHKATNGHIHELWLDGSGWNVGDISNLSPPAIASKLSSVVRADGINSVVYRSTTNRIIEIALVSGTWTWFDLSNAGGGTPAGNPVAYVRNDGVSAVVYRGADGNIHELRLGAAGWLATNLTAQAGSAVVASSDPSAFVRADGYSSVVFRGGTTVYELFKSNKGAWGIGAPSSLSPGAPAAAGKPFGYTHADGVMAIAYRSTANKIVELWADATGWHHGELTNAINASGDPVAYVRTDSLESIMYRTTANQIYETVNAPWGTWNLSATPGAGTTATNPSAVIRKDGYHSVVYKLANNHVAELYWKPGMASWQASDVTNLAGETP